MSLAHDHPLRPTLSNTMSATGSTGSSTWTSSDSTVTPEIFPAHLLVPPSQRRNGAIIRSQTLTDDQRANIALLESHFMGRRYMLPIYEGSKDRAPLSEREMMFLVSVVEGSVCYDHTPLRSHTWLPNFVDGATCLVCYRHVIRR